MTAAIIVTGLLCFCLVRLLLVPLFQYLRDPKGLRRYPSISLFAGISDWPFCLLSARGFRTKDLLQLHKTLDTPILRIGPNSLSFAHRDAIRDIYGHSTRCVKDIKYEVTATEHPHLFDVRDKVKHGEKRKRLSAAFAIKHLESWEHKVALTTERFLAALDKRCAKSTDAGTPSGPEACVVDWNYWANLFTIEAINYLACTSVLGLLEQGHDEVDAQKLDGTMYRASYRTSQNSNARAASILVWDYRDFHKLVWVSKLFPYWRQLWSSAAAFNDIVYHQAHLRLNRWRSGEELDDFFTALMYDRNGQSYDLEWGEIAGEIAAILDAGAETTAIALTYVLYQLIKHPSHLGALREELSTVLGPEDLVAPYDKIKNLPFLKACLDESMRIIPPTSMGLPRRTPAEGASIMGEWIPGDTSVAMPIYAAHHDAKIFPQPGTFDPHRWMDPAERRRMESYFVPFSAGGRGCIGRNISYLEQFIVLASVVHRYDFALVDEHKSLHRHEAFNLLVGEMPIELWHR